MRTQPGPFEQYHFTRAALHCDSCVVLAAQYGSSGHGGKDGLRRTLNKGALYPALALAIQKHAALGVRAIQRTVNKHRFVRLDEIDLDSTVTFLDLEGCDIAKVLNDQLDTEFDISQKAPLWRLLVLNEHIVVFAWHHGIGDGMSGLAFHTTLLNALNDTSIPHGPPSDVVTTIISVPTSLELTPPVESTVDVSPPLSMIVHAVGDLFIPASWTKLAKAWTGGPVTKSPSPKVRLTVLPFSPEEVTTLLARARAHKSSVTAVIYCAAVAAISEVVAKVPGTHKILSSVVPVSMRGLSGTPAEAFTMEVGTYHGYPPINATFSWEMAAQVTEELQKVKAAGARDTGLLKFLFGNYASWFEGQYGKKRSATLTLSNLGVFNCPGRNDSAWRVQDMWFGQSDAHTSGAIKFNFVTLANGGMNTVFTSGVNSLDVELFTSINEQFAVIVRRLLNAPTSRPQS